MLFTHGRVTPSIFREVIDRVSGRLSEWKAKLLSLAGRATLIQSVTAAIPNHLMQSTWLPTSTCDQLDRLNRNFLWSSNHTQRKIHLVGWQKVTKAKSCGGLGIRPTRKANIALLAKVGWKTMVGENTLWGATFRQKYLKRGEITDYKPKNEDSYVWKGVVKSSKAVTGCFKWRMGNGKTISLWFDKWVGKAPLYTLVDGEIKDDEVGWKVEEILGPNEIWEADKIQSKLSKEARDLIKAMPIPLFGDQEDIRIWDGSPNGKFSCKSAYESILDGEVLGTGPQSNCWTWLWKIQSSNRLKHFIWLCLHGSIATNSLWHTRKLSDSAVCTRCNIHEESIVHALRDCPNAQSVWEFLIAPTQFLRFKCLDSLSWIRENLTHENFENIILPSIPWPVIFLATVWSIWKSRNKFIFQSIREHTRQVIFAIKILAEDLSRGFAPKKGKEQKIKDHTRWLKPGHGWVKLNTDGSVFTTTNSAAAGGLIRDDKGEWIIGFTQHLGNVSITVAELLAVREGLKLAWERRVPRIEVEIDSEVVVKLIRDANVVGHPLEVIIHDCRRLLGMPWESRISHIGRSGNTCADALARMGHGATNSCCILKDPPLEVLSYLEADGSI